MKTIITAGLIALFCLHSGVAAACTPDEDWRTYITSRTVPECVTIVPVEGRSLWEGEAMVRLENRCGAPIDVICREGPPTPGNPFGCDCEDLGIEAATGRYLELRGPGACTAHVTIRELEYQFEVDVQTESSGSCNGCSAAPWSRSVARVPGWPTGGLFATVFFMIGRTRRRPTGGNLS